MAQSSKKMTERQQKIARPCDEKRKRIHNEENAEDGCAQKMKRGRPKRCWKDECQRDRKSIGIEWTKRWKGSRR